MLPDYNENDGLIAEIEDAIEHTNTYKLHTNINRCYGLVDGIEALKQAIFLMLSIERYDYVIYSWNTGIEIKDLIGKPVQYVISELKRRIPECLLQDDRILKVDNFEFEVNKKKLHCIFEIESIYGTFQAEREVVY